MKSKCRVGRQHLAVSISWLLCTFTSSAAAPPNDTLRSQTLDRLHFDHATNLFADAARKCAIVLHGMPVQSSAADGSSITLTIGGEPNTNLHVGLAVPIDHDGYFLTAAHVADLSPMNLVFYDGNRLRAEPARVVATLPNRTKRSRELDLAIIHINAEVAETFKWSDANEMHSGNLVFEIGATSQIQSNTNMLIQPACFAGKIQRITLLPDGGLVLKSDLPTRKGDSGGPILTTHGKLLGILSGPGQNIFGQERSFANRPDLDWLRDSIAADRNVPPQFIAASAPSRAIGGETIQIVVRLTPAF